jgi:mycothiol synthase
MAHRALTDDELPAGVRAFRPGDEVDILGAMHRMHDRGELHGVDRPFLAESAERMAAEPWIVSVAEDAGRLAGWVAPIHDDLSVDLPFRRRGHGRRLFDAGRRMAATMGRPDLRLWVPHRADAESFARAMGLRYQSSLWKLRMDPGTPVVAPSFGDDVVVRWVEAGADDAAFVEVANEIFLDHPSPISLELAHVARVHAKRGFDPSTLLLVAPATDRDRIIGFCRIGAWSDDAGELVGDVRLVGVVRAFRGRGLGRQLVRWGVEALRERGAGVIHLDVDSENADALHLYEAIGFAPEVEWPHWAVPVAGCS